MQTESFISIFNQSIQSLSCGWKEKYGDLLSSEHWTIIGRRIFFFAFKGKIYCDSLPTFSEEIIPDYSRHYQYFEQIKLMAHKPDNLSSQLIARLIEETPIESLLVILGQRKTPATISDKNGIPPTKEQLLESCLEPYNEHICKASRAREKHAARTTGDTFWGAIEGTPQEKEQITITAVKKIIEEKTWWNVFTHYKHDIVYEIRVASGEGIR